MAEVLFYHLEHATLNATLPKLLAMCGDRGWRVVVQAGSPERLDAIDAHLWSFSDESFLAHGTARDGFAAEQPIFLTTNAENPNGATVRFLVDRAPLPDEVTDLAAYQRVVTIFDGRDPDALAEARAAWKRCKDGGLTLKYYQQNPAGGWELKSQTVKSETGGQPG